MTQHKNRPQLEFIRIIGDGYDQEVQCTICGFFGRLMSDFSYLKAGFNGIKAGDPDDLDMQECGHCGARLYWDDIPVT